MEPIDQGFRALDNDQGFRALDNDQRFGAGPRAGSVPARGLSEKEMARSGSEKRQRQHVHKARFDDREDALVREQAARFGVSVASLIRYAVLKLPPLRARRQPQANKQEIARLIGELGALKSALKQTADKGSPRVCERHVEAACRDIADMCRAALVALEREP